jgi:tripartite-type tricarboxylate transporter receptor subunit TctC
MFITQVFSGERVRLRRFSVLVLAAVFGLGALTAPKANAADYPTRNVRVLIPFSAGGAADVLLRIVANALSEHWKQTVIVDNRPGGNSVVATVAAISSPADGYTLLFGADQNITINPAMGPVPYSVEKDLAPITVIANNPMLLVVNKDVPAKNLSEFIAFAKSQPKAVRFGSSGAGSVQRLTMEMFAQAADIDLLHVPYKGSNETVAAMLTGEIHATFNGISNFVELLKADKLRALAIATRERSPQVPDILPVREAGGEKLKDFEGGSWFGLLAPAGTPPEIISQVRRDVATVLSKPEVKARIEQRGFQIVANTEQEFGQLIRDNTKSWLHVIDKAAIRPE